MYRCRYRPYRSMYAVRVEILVAEEDVRVLLVHAVLWVPPARSDPLALREEVLDLVQRDPPDLRDRGDFRDFLG